jgi:hypothetical protein
MKITTPLADPCTCRISTIYNQRVLRSLGEISYHRLKDCHIDFINLRDISIKPHNEEIHNLYSSPSIIRIIKSRRMRWAGHVACMGRRRKKNAYRILVEKPKRKRPLGRPGCRWEDNIKMNPREIGWGDMD